MALVQVIAQYHATLPITLLEAHTLVHVFSALCMYLLWLGKPKDVNSATILSTDLFRAELAEFLVCSYDLVHAQWEEYNARFYFDYLFFWGIAEINLLSMADTLEDSPKETKSFLGSDEPGQWEVKVRVLPNAEVKETLYTGQNLDCGIGGRTGDDHHPTLTYELSAKDIN